MGEMGGGQPQIANRQSVDSGHRLTSYVTSSPRSASVMRILEIFSQGPWSTRVTSGYSSSLSRVFSERLRREKANDIKGGTWERRSCHGTATVKVMTHLQTRAPCTKQTPLTCSPPSQTQTATIFSMTVFWQIIAPTCFMDYCLPWTCGAASWGLVPSSWSCWLSRWWLNRRQE